MTAAPSLWRADGKPGRRLPALSLALDLRSGEVSTARLRLPAGAGLSVREWVRLAAPNGETGVYRVCRTETDYAAGIQTAELEHGLAVLEDTLLPDEDITLDGSAEEVLRSKELEEVFGIHTGFYRAEDDLHIYLKP